MRPIGVNGQRNTGNRATKSCKSAHSGHQRDIATEKTTNTDVYDDIWLLISVSLVFENNEKTRNLLEATGAFPDSLKNVLNTDRRSTDKNEPTGS